MNRPEYLALNRHAVVRSMSRYRETAFWRPLWLRPATGKRTSNALRLTVCRANARRLLAMLCTLFLPCACGKAPARAAAQSQLTSPSNYVFGDTLYPHASVPRLGKGQSYTDGPYHTTITRITDSAKDGSGAWGTITGYATWDPMSADGKYLLLYGLADIRTAAGYKLYDPQKLRFLENLPLEWYNGQDPEPRWDRTGTHAARLLYRKDKQLRYYDVVTHRDGLVRDFSSDFPTVGKTFYILNGEEGSPSTDGRYWAFMLKNGAAPYEVSKVFVYDLADDRVISSKDTAGHSPNNTMMSPSGLYVYVAYAWTGKGGEFDGPHAYSRDFSKSVRIATDVPHLNFGWTKQGNEVAVSLNPGTDHLQMVRLDTGQVFNLYYQGDMGWEGSNLLHGYTSRQGWAFISTYSSSNKYWSDNQIFAIELDEQRVKAAPVHPRIWRIASTWNAIGREYYYEQPNAQIDAGGTRIWWGANGAIDGARPDVYQVTLPASWWEELSK